MECNKDIRFLQCHSPYFVYSAVSGYAFIHFLVNFSYVSHTAAINLFISFWLQFPIVYFFPSIFSPISRHNKLHNTYCIFSPGELCHVICGCNVMTHYCPLFFCLFLHFLYFEVFLFLLCYFFDGRGLDCDCCCSWLENVSYAKAITIRPIIHNWVNVSGYVFVSESLVIDIELKLIKVLTLIYNCSISRFDYKRHIIEIIVLMPKQTNQHPIRWYTIPLSYLLSKSIYCFCNRLKISPTDLIPIFPSQKGKKKKLFFLFFVKWIWSGFLLCIMSRFLYKYYLRYFLG